MRQVRLNYFPCNVWFATLHTPPKSESLPFDDLLVDLLVMNHESKAKNMFWSEACRVYAQVTQLLIEKEQH